MDFLLVELREGRWEPMVDRVWQLEIGGTEESKAQERSHRTSEPVVL